MENKRYCSVCGTEMSMTPDNKLNWVKNPGICVEEIGYRSGIVYKCPKSSFFNKHDQYFLESKLK